MPPGLYLRLPQCRSLWNQAILVARCARI